VTSLAFVWFAKRARDDIDGVSTEELVPRPAPLRSAQRNMSDRVLRLFLPTSTPLEPRLREALARPNARRLSLGLVAASWFVVLSSLVRHGRRPWNLDDDTRRRFLDGLAGSPTWWVRQLTEIVKLAAAFAAPTEATKGA
jgi:hypothetical protein